MAKNTPILVIGAGVSGLSSAILLARAGHEVAIWAKDFTADTTSSIAAAFWYPYLCNPRDKAITWSKDTYDYLVEHAIDDSRAGTKYIQFTEYLKTPSPDPWWKPAVEVFERPTPAELPTGFVDGYRTRAILMDTTSYLPWLLDQATSLGITITQRNVENIDETLDQFDIVVNCSGLGARELCGDTTVFPVRGQVLRVKPTGLDHVVADESGPTLVYAIPRFDDVIVGGTAQANNWNLDPDEADTAAILKNIHTISDRFKNPEILEVKVGLRPARPEIRLERESLGGKTIVHNYGHGGAGFTLSWGCAKEVVEMVSQA